MVVWAGGVLLITLPWIERDDAGVPTAAHHIQCCGGHSGPQLVIIGGRKSGEGKH